MKSKYKVHTVAAQEIPLVVPINGKDTKVNVPGLVIELVNELEAHTYRFVPEDMDAALAMYVPGAEIIVELSAAE